MWATVGLDLSIGGVWPDCPIYQSYRGRSLLLLPGDERCLASVNVEVAEGETLDAAATLLNRFVSAAAWGSHGLLFSRRQRGGGSAPGRLGRGPTDHAFASPQHPRACPLWAPEPDTLDETVALARYSEAIRLQSSMFSFLLLYQIPEGLSGGVQGAIDRHFGELRHALERPEWVSPWPTMELSPKGLHSHLRETRRNAIAHARTGGNRGKAPTTQLDPDDVSQTSPIAEDREILKQLAERVIELDYRVRRRPPAEWAPVWSRVD